MQELKDHYMGATAFSNEALDKIAEENLWNIWVPKQFGGLEMPFREGLNKLKELARLDGSLGWTVTLCAGANYFIGNLQPEVAEEIFGKGQVIFGGSGGMFGTAEKEGSSYRLNGTWRYATGATYLSHFTLNARIVENGEVLVNEDGSPMFLSFVLPASKVEVIEDWNTMGLKASVTHSFKVENVLVNEKYSFVYNRFYLPQTVFKIHFSLFADLTLWVNYIGMAEHLLEEAAEVAEPMSIKSLQSVIAAANARVEEYSGKVEGIAEKGDEFTEDFIQSVHQVAAGSVKELSTAIVELYPLLGVKASRESHPINQVFRDYFTATQHHIFTKS